MNYISYIRLLGTLYNVTTYKCLLGYSIAIGTYRGYNFSKLLVKDEDINSKLISTKIGNKLLGMGAGIVFTLILFPNSIYNNIRRLEINIRGLDEEKEKEWYNKLI